MKLADRLNSIRQAYPACETLAYTDLSSGVILSWSASAALRQEELNSLSDNATMMLNGNSSQHLSAVLGEPENSDVFHAIIIEPTYVVIFLRSLQNPDDVLCCVCTPSIDIAAFLFEIRLHLDQIADEA